MRRYIVAHATHERGHQSVQRETTWVRMSHHFQMPTSRIWQKLSHIQLQKVGYQYFVYLILFLLLSLVTKFIFVTNIKDYQQGKSQMKMKIYFS